MQKVAEVIGGIGMLILVYLLLANGGQTVSIISTIGGNSIAGIKALQGR